MAGSQPEMREVDFSRRRVVRSLARDGSASPKAPFGAAVTCLAEMKSDSLTWLWGDVLAEGHVTLLTGASGVGKSFVAMNLVAAVTWGERDSRAETRGEPAEVLLISPEAELGDVVGPRLSAAGAEMTRVHALRGIRRSPIRADDADCRAFQLDEDLRLLEHEIAERKAAGTPLRLIVIDPLPVELFAYRYGTANLIRTLRELAEIAAWSHVAILLVADNSTRLSGSWGNLDKVLHATAQSVWTIVDNREHSDPRVFFPYPPGYQGPREDEPELESERLLLSVKASLKHKTSGLSFRIDDACVEWNAEPVDVTAEQYFSPEYDQSRSVRLLMEQEWSELARATHWLKRRLAVGVTALRELRRAAEEQDISFSTLRRAFCGLNGVARRIGNSRLWGWALPEHDAESGRLPAWRQVEEHDASSASPTRTRVEPPKTAGPVEQFAHSMTPDEPECTKKGVRPLATNVESRREHNGRGSDPVFCAEPTLDELRPGERESDQVFELVDGSLVSKGYLDLLKQEAAEEAAALAARGTRLPFS